MGARLAGLLLLLFIQAQPPANAPLTPESAIGTWQGDAAHAGERRAVVVEFARGRDGNVWALVTLPAIHASRIVIGRVERAGEDVRAGTTIFSWNASAGTLSFTLPADLVPKYTMRVALRRIAAAATVTRPAIDAPARQPIWTFDLGAPSWADVLHANGTVYVGTEDGRLHAVDGRSGRERWAFQAGGAIRARPAPAGQDLIVPSDDGFLYRLGQRTGAIVWKTRIGAPFTRPPLATSRYETRASSPVIAGNHLFVGTHDGRLLSISLQSGTIEWSVATGDAITATPVIANGVVYCGSFDGTLYAVRAADGGIVWKHAAGAPVTGAVALEKDLVIVGSRTYEIEAIEASTGAPRWTRYVWFSWIESAPVVENGVVYVGSSDAAAVMALDAATGRTRWTADAGGSAWATPLLAGDALYEPVVGVSHYIAPHRGGVLAVDRQSGRPRWYLPASEPKSASGEVTPYGFAGTAAIGAYLYTAGLDGRLYALPR